MAARSSWQLLVLFLLSSSCALAHDGTRLRSDRDSLDLESYNKAIISEATEAWKLEIAEPKVVVVEVIGASSTYALQEAGSKGKSGPPTQDDAIEVELRKRSPTVDEAARITTPPTNPITLVARQGQDQINQLNSRIQSLQQSAQQALQSLSDASRQVSQASQQLSQSAQRLSQESQRLSQASQQLSQNLQQATQSVSNLNGALTSALSASSSAFSSCTNSASNAIAAASRDAQSQVGQALAQATLARNEADREIQQAQGQAVSVTQAAAAIVGTFIGSSLLTVTVVLIILRWRRQRQREEFQALSQAGSYYNGPGPGSERKRSFDSSAPRDVKEPLPPSDGPRYERPPTAGGSSATYLRRYNTEASQRPGNDVERGGNMLMPRPAAKPPEQQQQQGGAGQALEIGYAQSFDYDGSRRPIQPADPEKFQLFDPPRPEAVHPNKKVGGASDANGEERKSGGKWSVFPKVPGQAAPAPAMAQPTPKRNSVLNLQRWLTTATVSPFGPFDKDTEAQQQQSLAGLQKRLSEVKWPLQSRGRGDPQRSDTQSTTTAAAQRSDDDDDDDDELKVPPPVVRDTDASRTVRLTPPVGIVGLPGVARKLPLRSE